MMDTTQQRQQADQQAGAGQQLDAAYPTPPDYFHSFTDENIAKYQADPTLPSGISLKYLSPPPPPSSGSYLMFGKTWQVSDDQPKTTDQKYPESPIDRIAELKKLNHAVVFEFLELVDILIKDPSQFGTKTESIHNIIISIHKLINEYRNHQAKETLKAMMKGQIEGKHEAARSIMKKCEEIEECVRKLRDEAGESGNKLNIDDAIDQTGSEKEESKGNEDFEVTGQGILLESIKNI